MEKQLKELLENKNINIFENKDDDLYIEVYSYNKDLSENKEYTKKIFNKIVKFKDDILDYYKKDRFIISCDSFSINGLYETNDLLLNKDFILTSLY